MGEPVYSTGDEYGMCSCGRVLLEVLRDGKRVGVTHSPEDEEHHLRYWSRPVEDLDDAFRRLAGEDGDD